MSKLPAAAFTIAYGAEAKKQATVAFATFRKHHPDIPIFLVDETSYRRFAGAAAPAHLGELVSLRVLVGWFLSLSYERVIHLDADVIIFGCLERLLDFEKKAAVTHDISTYTMRAPELPRLNAGVLAARSTSFWIEWADIIYSTLLPKETTNFFDQLALRRLVKKNPDDFEIIDEKTPGIFYNLSIREEPGDWRWEKEKLLRGNAEARLYHRAGERELQSTLPEPLQKKIEELAAGASLENLKAPWENFDPALVAQFESALTEFFKSLPLRRDPAFEDLYRQSGEVYRTDTPLQWDRLRAFDEKIFKRALQKSPPAFLYQSTG